MGQTGTSRLRKDAAKAVVRLQKVIAGVSEGKSNRRIAQELGCNEKSVRRDRQKVEKLSPSELEVILRGATVEPILRAARHNHDEISSSARTREIAALARLIRDCLDKPWAQSQLLPWNRAEWMNNPRAPRTETGEWHLSSSYKEQVLKQVVLGLRLHGLEFVSPPQGAKEVIGPSRPPEPPQSEGMVGRINWFAAWLLAWLPRLAPNMATVEAALKEARRPLEREHSPVVFDPPLPKPRRKHRRTRPATKTQNEAPTRRWTAT